MNHSARRINFLAGMIGAKRYLEIGVHSGQTFLDVGIDNKIAVDPQFQFDFLPYQSERVLFRVQTSDEFFSQTTGSDQFDLVFIDGLDSFEQTFRDFCSAIECTHARSIIVVDDTLPNDVFSCLGTSAEAVRFRTEHNPAIQDGSWHGDVYKLVFVIRDFFMKFDYVTVTDGGNPQTIVWRRSAPARSFAPLFGNLEKISRLSFFDMKNNPGAFNFMPEEAALQHVRGQLAGPRPVSKGAATAG